MPSLAEGYASLGVFKVFYYSYKILRHIIVVSLLGRQASLEYSGCPVQFY
jgi:hypothetical protein